MHEAALGWTGAAVKQDAAGLRRFLAAMTRLAAAVPEARTLLSRAYELGESPQQQTTHLTRLLETHGAARLHRAVVEALERDTPRAASVAFLIRKYERETAPPPEVDLSRYPEYEALYVQPHGLDTYDKLANPKAANHDEPAD